ncbi:ATP synthase F0 subunit A [bacterium]|nr:ATP synthase F0 subunit A [bacterium]
MTIPPAAAEQIFHIGTFPITNAMVNGWIAVAFFVLVAILVSGKKKLVPSGVQNIAEAVVEFMLGEVQKVTGDPKRARLFLPIVGTIFLFVLFSNWLGLIPGTGSIGFWEVKHGVRELIPLLRPAGSDLNFTLAIAAFAVLASHAFGIRALGVTNHVSKFVNVRGIFRAFKHGPMAVVVACIEFGVGLIEIVSEIAKVLSLSLRLFGNVFAGEVLMTVMLGIFAYLLPLPFVFLEVLVGVIQATVFSLLTLAYLTVATEAHGEEHAEAESHH